jgi:hypothetical protein
MNVVYARTHAHTHTPIAWLVSRETLGSILVQYAANRKVRGP